MRFQNVSVHSTSSAENSNQLDTLIKVFDFQLMNGSMDFSEIVLNIYSLQCCTISAFHVF